MATTTAVSKEPPQQQPQATSSSPEEECMRRNTDCVYFLASPLTCKKGSECEYRHSEAARMNPKDCYYWLNGNCLMPKCAYRHPPLDGLVPPQASNFAGTFPPPIASGPHVSLTLQSAAKQAVPCVFFQKGYCLKGDRCPFLHGPAPPPVIKSQQVSVSTAAPDAPTLKKTFGGLEKCTQPKLTFQANASKIAVAPRQQPQVANAAPKVQVARPSEGTTGVKRFPQSDSGFEEAPQHKGRTGAPVDNGNLRGRAALPHRATTVDDYNQQNGRDIDDSLRESSPGFDVLVDDKLREDEYYPTEDQYVRMRGHEGTSLDDFDGGHLDDYNPVVTVDADIYRSRRGYDSYGGYQDKYARKHREASRERSLEEPVHYDRRGSFESRSSYMPQNSDLRHLLSKQRKGNGLRSVVNPDFNPDSNSEDQAYRNSRRDTRRSPVRENSIGSRLQGRIRLPRRSPPASGGNMNSERDYESRRNWGRISPTRPQVPSRQGRLRDRLGRRIQDESNEDINFRGQMRKGPSPGNGADFAGPKRLSELRTSNQSDTTQHTYQQSVSDGKLRDTVLPSSLGTDSGLSFDAPKPLSEILKRKRDAGVKSDDKETTVQVESNIKSVVEPGKQIALSTEPVQRQAVAEEENNSSIPEADEDEGELSNKKIRIIEDESFIPNYEEQHENEEGLPGADVEEQGDSPRADVEEQEYEGYDHGGYEYEHYDVEGYNLNEEEAAEHEGDFMDEDDGDDFAKKLGVSF